MQWHEWGHAGGAYSTEASESDDTEEDDSPYPVYLPNDSDVVRALPERSLPERIALQPCRMHLSKPQYHHRALPRNVFPMHYIPCV